MITFNKKFNFKKLLVNLYNKRGISLNHAKLKHAELNHAKLNHAKLNCAELNHAELNCAELNHAELNDAKLNHAKLNHAELNGACLFGAQLSGSNLPSQREQFEKLNLEKTKEGYIVYKSFNENNNAPSYWKIEKGSEIEEVVCTDRTIDCACGVNVATLEWCKKNCSNPIWKCLLKFEDIIDCVIPFYNDGKFRCRKITLIEPL